MYTLHYVTYTNLHTYISHIHILHILYISHTIYMTHMCVIHFYKICLYLIYIYKDEIFIFIIYVI